MADSGGSTLIWDDLQLALWFGLIGALAFFVAWKKGYFRLPKYPLSLQPPTISIYHLFLGFGGYLGISFYLSPFLAAKMQEIIPVSNGNIAFYISWLNFSTELAVLIYLFLFFFLLFPVGKSIFKYATTSSYVDIAMGGATWLIAFPIMIFWGQLLNILIYLLFKVKDLPEQLAIQYLKMTMNHPLLFAMALFCIIILAPLVEEFMFRGLLQNWFKRYLGTYWAILLTAILFSFFHFSSSQGLGNISIIGSLFILACFLGFIYERQKSLISSITLHASFNLISIINLLSLKE